MIVVAGNISVKPESLGAAIELCKWMTAETVVENGCIVYSFYESLNDPHILHVFEEWESIEDLGLHLAASHFVKFIAEIEPMLAVPPEVKVYEIESVRPL